MPTEWRDFAHCAIAVLRAIAEAASKRPAVFMGAVLVVLALVYGARLQPQHGWSDDAVSYIRHAQNILAGRDYDDIGWSYTPAFRAPAVIYPPLLPLLLAPLLAICGLNFLVLKGAALVIFLLSLAAAWVALRDLLTPLQAAIAVTLMGISHALWVQADHIGSDYLLLLLVCLWISWMSASAKALHSGALAFHAGVAALLIVLATTARTVAGVVMPGALLLFCVLQPRARRLAAASLAWTVPALVILAQFSPTGGGNYGGNFAVLFSWMTLRRNAIQYPLALGELSGGGPWLAIAVGALLTLGIVSLSPRSLWVHFAIAYCGVLLLWPFSDPVRFLIPVTPLLFGCVVRGAGMAAGALGKRGARAMATALLAGAVALQAAAHARAFGGDGINSPAAMELYAAIRAHTRPHEVVVARKPRAVVLFAARPSARYANLAPPAMTRDVCSVHAGVIVSAPSVFEDDRAYLEPWLQANAPHVETVFRNSRYGLYRLRPEACRLTADAGYER